MQCSHRSLSVISLTAWASPPSLPPAPGRDQEAKSFVQKKNWLDLISNQKAVKHLSASQLRAPDRQTLCFIWSWSSLQSLTVHIFFLMSFYVSLCFQYQLVIKQLTSRKINLRFVRYCQGVYNHQGWLGTKCQDSGNFYVITSVFDVWYIKHLPK